MSEINLQASDIREFYEDLYEIQKDRVKDYSLVENVSSATVPEWKQLMWGEGLLVSEERCGFSAYNLYFAYPEFVDGYENDGGERYYA